MDVSIIILSLVFVGCIYGFIIDFEGHSEFYTDGVNIDYVPYEH